MPEQSVATRVVVSLVRDKITGEDENGPPDLSTTLTTTMSTFLSQQSIIAKAEPSVRSRPVTSRTITAPPATTASAPVAAKKPPASDKAGSETGITSTVLTICPLTAKISLASISESKLKILRPDHAPCIVPCKDP
ncbi:uncharacterized protein PV06_05441 [Exophiala oligosperma]|uniref:Uncharacterized protein n=1 Tax=Exophiala oligosperma TaxID=215243 RepID=A0A0D2E1Y8_9EURO|nr:uncharacterized protein PV06_05441 [Exophiala oligosperma]KIW41834.1 hypothetical protein PV06_05441 [Exophiala oligosperma]